MKAVKIGFGIIAIGILSFLLQFITNHASGEVQPITEVKEELEEITQEELNVLAELFVISQEIIETEGEINRITGEIALEQKKVEMMEKQIAKEQENYDFNLEVLSQVLVYYQRGGPATYLEMLLQSDSLTDFLKTINIIKDMSHNTNELLIELESTRIMLEEGQLILEEQLTLLEQKRVELEEPLHKKQKLKEEQEIYLVSLKDKKVMFQQQLTQIENNWADCKLLFASLLEEITRIVGEGYLTTDDLDLSLGFTKIEGTLYEDSLNEILITYGEITEINFLFMEEGIKVEIPEKKLVLYGNFVIEGKTGMKFEVESGSFYQLPLEESSLGELFHEGPLLIDFKTLAGDMLLIDFELQSLDLYEGYLDFTIKPIFFFGM